MRATVFIGAWLIGVTGFPLALQSAPIDDCVSPQNIESVTADGDLRDPPQAMALLAGADIDTPVLRPELMVLSAPPTDVARDDLASLEPVASAAGGVNPEARVSTIAPAATAGRAAPVEGDSSEIPVARASVPAAEILFGTPLYEAASRLRETEGGESLFTSDLLKQNLQPAGSVETASECPAPATCIDDYLWALYQRAPKIDTNRVTQRIKVKTKVALKKKNKTVTVTKTIIKTNTKYVVGDFSWKDPIAAQRAGMSLKDYVIGGMDPDFKLKLSRALRAMEYAGHMPGITSAFRDNYRQAIASGTKAASDSSYHGGSRRGGYGYGVAVDLVSVKGETRYQRYASSQELWKWIDAHEDELGIGRPYLHRDPPHVAPRDGAEYAAKRGRLIAQKREMQKETRRRLASLTNGAKLAKLKVSSLQPKSGERTSKNDRSLIKRAKLANSSAVASVQPVPRSPKKLARALQ